jgi:predicted ribosomally synthesized peptide with nif11-like leader
MSEESARSFLEKLKSDEAFANQIAEADFEECRKLTKDSGFDFTKEEIDVVASELSDDDLESVAGGVGRGAARSRSGACVSRMYGCTNGCEGGLW